MVCIVCAVDTSIWAHCLLRNWRFQVPKNLRNDLSQRRPAIIVWRWVRDLRAQPCGLVEQQGVAYAKTVAETMNLKLDADNPADREKLRRAVLDLVAGREMPKQKGRG